MRNCRGLDAVVTAAVPPSEDVDFSGVDEGVAFAVVHAQRTDTSAPIVRIRLTLQSMYVAGKLRE